MYWPIRTNSQENQKSVESATAQASIANIGMTKQTKPNAKNSVMIGSIFDTFASHVTDVAKYAAYLGVSEDIRRLENDIIR